MNETLLNKKISIERCIAHIKQYYSAVSELPFDRDFLKQDAIGMNLQRICDLAIDMANHVIKCRKLGLPQDSRDTFQLLHRAGFITDSQLRMAQGMVGFRNVLVHEYQKLDLSIMVDVIENRLSEIIEFANSLIQAAG